MPDEARLDLTALRPDEVPLALADHHRAGAVGDAVTVMLPATPGPEWAADQVHGGGFAVQDGPAARPGAGGPVDVEDSRPGDARGPVDVEDSRPGDAGGPVVVVATRARTLPDYVGAGMRLLVCGLNPSLYAADVGVGFARPGNRFWPALLAAGLADADRDPRRLLVEGRIGMTDLVKRATPRADELAVEEYREGVARLERRCAALGPGAVCVVGFDGWRKVVDRRARAGWQPTGLGGRPVYLMPNPSGLNAHTRLAGFVEHVQHAAQGP